MIENTKEKLFILHDGNTLPEAVQNLSDDHDLVKHNIHKAGELGRKLEDPGVIVFYTDHLGESFILQANRIIEQLRLPSVLLSGTVPGLPILETAAKKAFSFIVYPPFSEETLRLTVRRLSEFIRFVDEIDLDQGLQKGEKISAPVLIHLKTKADTLFHEIRNSMQIRDELKDKTMKLAQQVREMNCLLQITTLSEKRGLSLENFMKESLRIIISACSEPKKCGGIMRFRDLEVGVGKIVEGAASLRRQLIFEEKPIGMIEVSNADIVSINDYHPEEKNLVIVTSKYLGQILLRKESETELLKFKELIHQSQSAILITGPKGEVEYTNPAFTKVFGFEFDAFSGTLFELAEKHNQNHDAYSQLIGKVSRKESWSGEIRARKSNGEMIWTHTTIAPVIKDGSVIHFIAQVNVIDEEKKLADELETSRKDLELITSNSPHGIVILDMDMRIIFANEKACEMLEVKRHGIIGRSPMDFVVPEEREFLTQRFRDRIRNKQVSDSVDFRALTESRHVKYFRIMTSKTTWKGEGAFLYNIIDVSSEKRMTNWLEHELHILRLFSEEMPVSKLLGKILNTLYKVDWIDCGGVYLVDKNNTGIELIFHDNLSEQFIEKVKYFPVSSNQYQALLKKKTLYFETRKLSGEHARLYEEEDLKAVIAFPLLHKDHPIGVMNLASRTSDQVPLEDRMMLFNIAHSLAYLLQKRSG